MKNFRLTHPVFDHLPLSLMEGKKGKRNIKAFTLVELIIVITILAILATIAFVSFKGYMSDARDSNRLATLNSIEKGLSLYQAKSGTLPDTESGVTITASGSIKVDLSYQGYFGDNQAKTINSNKTPLDPLDNSKYVYAISADKTKYQLLAYMENTNNLAFINQTYADDLSTRNIRSIGNNVGIVLNSDNSLVNTGVNVLTGTTSYKIQFNGTDSIVGTGNTLFSNIYNRRDDLIASKDIAKLDDSLVGYWDMETLTGTKLKDLSGKGNDGNISTILPGNVEGKVGKAMRLYGSGGYIIIPNSTSLNPSKITLCNWGQRLGDNGTLWSNPIYKEDWINKKGYNFYFSYSNDHFGFRILGNSNNFDIYKWNQNIYNFNHYCSTYDNNIVNIYKNGIKIKSGTGILENSNVDLFLGGSNNISTLNGIIDEVRIYNRALSDLEIQNLYNSTK